MPDPRLRYLRAELRRTAIRLQAETERLHEIQEEINHLEDELAPRKRRFGVIQGGALAAAATATVEWIREHPTATALVAVVSVGGIAGLGGYSIWDNPVRHNPSMALPAPSILTPPSPQPGIVPAPSQAATRHAAPAAPHVTPQPPNPTPTCLDAGGVNVVAGQLCVTAQPPTSTSGLNQVVDTPRLAAVTLPAPINTVVVPNPAPTTIPTIPKPVQSPTPSPKPQPATQPCGGINVNLAVVGICLLG